MLPPNCEHFRNHFEPCRVEPYDGILSRHRRECAACARWAARLEVFVMPAPALPLPSRLRSRLLAIAAPPPLPWWIRDGSAALAASLVLALGLSLLVDVRWLSASANRLEERAAHLLEIGHAQRHATALRLSRAARERRAELEEGAELLGTRFFEIREFLRQEANELYERASSLTFENPHSQGDDDGKS